LSYQIQLYPSPICAIAYSEPFRDAHNYFRAVLHADERSERALSLTEHIIELNPANYTAWYFRRLCLFDLNKDLKAELKFVEELARDHPKNYQIWYHRRALIEKLGKEGVSQELPFTAEVLEEDNKNYHAWSHRQLTILKFNLWEKELDFIETLLKEDLRNNSAWNHRYFVISNTTLMSPEVRKQEIEYSTNWIKKAPNNESPWNYMAGIVKGQKFANYPEIKEFCLEAKQKWPTCAHALAILSAIYEEESTKESLVLAAECCESLAKGIDDIHSKYWFWKKQQLEEKGPTN